MPKAELTTPRGTTAKTKTKGHSRYQRAVDAIAELTPSERARLMTKLQKKPSPGRERLEREVRQAEEEIARGEYFVGTAEEVIRELNR